MRDHLNRCIIINYADLLMPRRGLKSVFVMWEKTTKTTPARAHENRTPSNPLVFFQFSPVNVYCGTALSLLGCCSKGGRSRMRMTMGNAIR